jgi:hypothetical protein
MRFELVLLQTLVVCPLAKLVKLMLEVVMTLIIASLIMIQTNEASAVVVKYWSALL